MAPTDRLSLGALLLGALLLSNPAKAEPPTEGPSLADRATARTLFFQAVEAAQAGEHAQAVDLFDRSNRLFPAPTAALGLARALVETGRWVRAAEIYYDISRRPEADDEPEAFRQARAASSTELEGLAERLPKVVVTVSGCAEPAVTLDGLALSEATFGVERPVDPGRHELRATAAGCEPTSRAFEVAPSAVEEIALVLAPTAPPLAPAAAPPPHEAPPKPAPAPLPPPPREENDGAGFRITGYTLGALGLAGLLGGAITGGLYLKAKATAEAECQSTGASAYQCSQAGLDAVDRGRTLEPINTALFVAGGVGLAAGVTFVILGHVGDDEVAASLTPGGASLRLRF
ncbi:MAG: tetratricopeptide repeat protein [Polyangiaceae bacterium]